MDGGATGSEPHRFTVADYHRMAEVGILDEDSRDGSEPEPDVAVLRPRVDDYETATPRAGDVLLVIEVADTSLGDDREVKAPLYAESGIIECWIVNLVERVVEVCRQPENGRYTQVRRIGADGVLDFVTLPDIVTLPGITLPAGDLLRPAAG